MLCEERGGYGAIKIIFSNTYITSVASFSCTGNGMSNEQQIIFVHCNEQRIYFSLILIRFIYFNSIKLKLKTKIQSLLKV